MLFTGWLIPYVQRSYAEDNALRLNGQQVTGFITRKEVWSGEDTSYHLYYEFSPSAGGANVTDGWRVSDSMYKSIEQGAPIEIVYSQSNPEYNFPIRSDRGRSLEYTLYSGIFFSIIGGLFVAWIANGFMIRITR